MCACDCLYRYSIDIHSDVLAAAESAKKRNPFPCPTTFGTALRYYIDLSGKPSSFLLRELVPFTADAKEKAFLQSLISSHEVCLSLVAVSGDTVLRVLGRLA
jgi:NADPH-ferrihemoprotein reductase